MKAIDNKFKYNEVFAHYEIPKSFLKSRKMDPTKVLTNEENALCAYIEEMANYRLSFTPTQLKLKVG